MLDQLSRDERLLLLKFVCAFAWTDLEVTDSEKAFVRRLVERFDLDTEDRSQVEAWLHTSPAPSELDPASIPAQHRRTFVEAARAMIYADGNVDDEEREQLDKLKAALLD